MLCIYICIVITIPTKIMRIFLLTFILLFLSQSVISQKTKIVYLDDYWNKTKQENAEYYRHIKKDSNDLYQVEDYYLSGQLQMSGHYSDKKLQYNIGEFNYYDTLGNLEMTEFYVDNEKEGAKKKMYPNGQVKVFEEYVDGRRHGQYREFYEDSTIRAEATFINGSIRGLAKRFSIDGKLILDMNIDTTGNGQLRAYYLNGDIRKEGAFEEGYRLGTWNTYNRGHELSKTKEYPKTVFEYQRSKGVVTYRTENLISEFFNGYDFGNEELFGLVYYPDVEAEFPGGSRGLQRYINSNVLYPAKAIDKNVQGKVYLSFVVEADGSISNIRVLKGHRLLKKESIRVVKNMPAWKPGEYKRKKVRTRCRLPIVYTLE